MSGIAAIYTRSARPAAAGDLAAMLSAMRWRGGDGRATWSGRGILLGTETRHVTPESVGEEHPFVDRRTGIVVLLDGRLDNRDDLQADLHDAVSKRDGDGAYVAAAYERWGAALAEKLLGDFALMVWDPREQRLVCARDVMGVRPLYYANAADGTLVIASAPAAILATGLIPDSLNEARALEHLVERGQHDSETLYSSVRRVPPAHTLVATRRAIAVRRHWDLTPGRILRYRDGRDYVAHAQAVLGQAVRAQSRTLGRVGILLSGGIDSSTVAATAAAAGIDCETLTVAFPGQDCDETPMASAVAASCGFNWRAIPYVPKGPDWYAASAQRHLELPDYPNGAILEPVRSGARDAGIRVLMTGFGGDEWFTGSPYRYADWLTDGAWMRASATLAGEMRIRGWRHPWREAALCGVWPVLPERMRATVKRVLGRRETLPPWIPAEAAQRTDLPPRVAVRVTPRPGETFAQADVRTLAMSGFRIHSEEMEDRATMEVGIEQRSPMYDRRVIEFAFALPDDQRWRGTMRKCILRAAAGERLAPVRGRRDKAEFSGTYIDALAGAGGEYPLTASRGWIDAAVARDMRRQAHAYRASGDHRFWACVGALWMFHAVETWLAAISRRAYDRPAPGYPAESSVPAGSHGVAAVL